MCAKGEWVPKNKKKERAWVGLAFFLKKKRERKQNVKKKMG